jgi:L-arabinonolactonase
MGGGVLEGVLRGLTQPIGQASVNTAAAARRGGPPATTTGAAATSPPRALPRVEAELVLDCRCGVGEGLFWDVDAQLVRFLDIPGKRLYAYDPLTLEVQSWPTPEQPGTFAKCRSAEAGFIVGFESGFALFNPVTEALTRCDMSGLVIDPSHGGRLNDGRCDRQGRLVCGGYNEASGGRQSRCFQVSPADLKVKDLLGFGIQCANSTCFSPDGTTMYFCDTPRRVIWAFDYDPKSGRATNQRDLVDFAAQGIDGMPDGATVDRDGNSSVPRAVFTINCPTTVIRTSSTY